MRKRVLVVQPYLGSSGGGNVVAAWALQALRDEFEVSLATLGTVDYEGLNRNFGTSLREGDFAVRSAPRSYRRLLSCIPTQGALMQIALATRWAKTLSAQERSDVILSTHNEMDFGRPGLQYVHYPWGYLPRPDIELRWFHHIPGFLAAYRAACRLAARGTEEGVRLNRSLANSQFVATKIRERYGIDSEVLYPPVPGGFPAVHWGKRRAAAVAIGRMHPVKRWENAVEVVELARARGLALGLTLICHPGEAGYERRIRTLASTRPWFRILSDLSRQDLAHEVAHHRYGIHAMEDEHFGIAVAEMVRAGCLPLVHDSGGPVEIVAGLRELRFRDAEEGARALLALVSDLSLQDRLRSKLAKQSESFSTETFCASLRRAVESFAAR